MSQIVIVDTTVLLNLLDVPRHNRNKDGVWQEFDALEEDGAKFLLPLAVVFQAGDHIGDMPNGSHRRRCAAALREQVRGALRKEASWELAQLAAEQDVEMWLTSFPDFATQRTGYGMSALSIVHAWESACKRIPGRRVRIWSLNRRLQGYDRAP